MKRYRRWHNEKHFFFLVTLFSCFVDFFFSAYINMETLA